MIEMAGDYENLLIDFFLYQRDCVAKGVPMDYDKVYAIISSSKVDLETKQKCFAKFTKTCIEVNKKLEE